MDDGKGGSFSTIFDGSFQPGVTHFLKTGLTTGYKYTFRAYAVNYNGLSLQSPDGVFYACSSPTLFSAPTVISQSTSAISI